MSLTYRPISAKNAQKFYNSFNKPKKYRIGGNKNDRYFQPYQDYRPPQPRTFLQSMAPFNYYGNGSFKNNFLINFNGGPVKEINPKKAKSKLCNTFRNNKFISLRYMRPCGCLTKYNSSKYIPYYPEYNGNENEYGDDCFDQDPNLFKSQNCKENRRYFTPQNIKLKNVDNQRKPFCKNIEMSNNNLKNNDTKEEMKEELKEEQFESQYTSRDSLNHFPYLKKKKKFYKTQIFNNYKPFLVDDYNLIFVNRYI